jgi:transposase InsO family protein
MPWHEVSAMDQRLEFVRLAMQDGVNRRELCRRFGISADIGYKWLARHRNGDTELAERSRRPHANPQRSAAATEAQVLAIRDAHPAWGARKIAHCLRRDGLIRDGLAPVVSTVHAILQRHGRIVPAMGGPVQPLGRFEKNAPNALWQMDFKGWIALTDGAPCHPLTMIDDHSRYTLCISACSNQQRLTVQQQLTQTFRRYGLPDAFYVDNGSPWSDSSGARWTALQVWLLKLGVEVIRARPYHPQGRGKNERFHRSLKAEVLALRRFKGIDDLQRALDAWRHVYNAERPHEGIGMMVPASRYRPSTRSMPAHVPEVTYDSGEIVRRVSTTRASVSFKGRLWPVPRAFCGEPLAIRPRGPDGHYDICFGSWQVAKIDLTTPGSVSDVSEQVSAMSPV